MLKLLRLPAAPHAGVATKRGDGQFQSALRLELIPRPSNDLIQYTCELRLETLAQACTFKGWLRAASKDYWPSREDYRLRE